MFKTITLTEKELAIFINARCWEDIKYITPKGLDEYSDATNAVNDILEENFHDF